MKLPIALVVSSLFVVLWEYLYGRNMLIPSLQASSRQQHFNYFTHILQESPKYCNTLNLNAGGALSILYLPSLRSVGPRRLFIGQRQLRPLQYKVWNRMVI